MRLATSPVGSLVNANGRPSPAYLALPENYNFGTPTVSQDFRLTKVFTVHERYKFSILAEMFNAFNISNKTGYSYTLDNASTATAVCQQGSTAGQSCSFGQATSRPGQTFGSAGPRAVQLGARFTF